MTSKFQLALVCYCSVNTSRYLTIAPLARASIMAIMHPASQPATENPCNGNRCEHLCLRTSFGAVCACDRESTLMADGRTCGTPSEDDVVGRRGTDSASFECSPPCSSGGSCMKEIATGRTVCMCQNGFTGDSCERADGPRAIWIFTGLVFIVLLTAMILKVGPKAYRYTSTL